MKPDFRQQRKPREHLFRVERRHNGVLLKVREFRLPEHPRRGDKMLANGETLIIREVFARSGYETDIIAA